MAATSQDSDERSIQSQGSDSSRTAPTKANNRIVGTMYLCKEIGCNKREDFCTVYRLATHLKQQHKRIRDMAERYTLADLAFCKDCRLPFAGTKGLQKHSDLGKCKRSVVSSTGPTTFSCAEAIQPQNDPSSVPDCMPIARARFKSVRSVSTSVVGPLREIATRIMRRLGDAMSNGDSTSTLMDAFLHLPAILLDGKGKPCSTARLHRECLQGDFEAREVLCLD
jgi:hypothetical protein